MSARTVSSAGEGAVRGTGGRLANPVRPVPVPRLSTGSALCQSCQHAAVLGEVARLAAGINDHVPYCAFAVDDEGPTAGHAAVPVKNPVLLGHCTVGPEVCEEAEAVAFLLGIGAQGVLAVDRDGQHLGVGIFED